MVLRHHVSIFASACDMVSIQPYRGGALSSTPLGTVHAHDIAARAIGVGCDEARGPLMLDAPAGDGCSGAPADAEAFTGEELLPGRPAKER